MKSGIYTITNLLDNKIYVGYTVNFGKREEDHFRKLNTNLHKNRHLQRAFNKYEEKNFKFEILEECCKKFLASQEHYWCNMLNTHNDKYGYNIRPTHPNEKTINSKEIREKISKSRTGKIPNWGEEYKKNRKIRVSLRGWTKEEIKKRSIKRKVPIICLSKDGEFLKRYDSGRDASKELSICYKLISMNCRKRCKSTKGYIFMHEEEYNLKFKG